MLTLCNVSMFDCILLKAYLRVGWVLPSGKGIHLLNYLRNVSAKRAEDNCEISSLQCTAYSLAAVEVV